MRWWPVIAVAGLFALGWAVGKGSTPLDDRFFQVHLPYWLRDFVQAPVQAAVLGAAVAYALWRKRWRLAVVAAVCPPLAVATAQGLKQLFGRGNDGGLAYPSGHITGLVSVAGMVVLVAGCRLWAVVSAAVVALVGMVVVGTSFHYFTDTVGALLLATAYVAVAARLVAPQQRHRGT